MGQADGSRITVGMEAPLGAGATTLDLPVGALRQRTYWQTVWSRVLRDPVTLVCSAVLILLCGSAIFAPWLGLADATATNSANRLLPVASPGHLLGTDELGRDMLSRLVYGGRLSLTMGIVPVASALVIGGTL